MTTSYTAAANGAGSAALARADAGAPVGAGAALRLVAVLARGWRTIVGVTLATVIISVLTALALPKSYLTAAVLVPFSGSGARSSVALSGLPAGVAGLVGGIGGGSPAERVLGPVLASRALSDSLIRRAGRTPQEQRAVSEVLHDGLRVVRNPDGSMVVWVRALDPELAARIANTYPDVVNRLLSLVSTNGALTKQQFLRAQLDTADAHLTASEQRLIEFAQRHAAPAAEQQAQRTLDAAASLQQAIFDQELAIGQLRRTATPDNPDLRAAQAQLEARRAQLRQLTSGTQGRSVFVPVERGTELRVASTRVEREYQQDQRVYASLAAALEDAQIDASNSLPVLSVLDAALVPGGPTRDLWNTATLALFGGLLLGVVAVLVRDVLARLRRDPSNAEFFAAFRRRGAGRERPAADVAHAA